MAAPGSLLHALSVRQAEHGLSGAMRQPAMARIGLGRMGAMMPGDQGGMSGFLDHITGSPLGQIGMALLAGGGGGIGNAAAMLMQQGMYNRLSRSQYAAAMAPRAEHIGNQIGMLDPQTGAFTPTYTEPQDDEIAKEIRGAGKDPSSPEGQQVYQQLLENREDPTVQIPLGDGRIYVGPKSQMQQYLQGGQPTPAPTAAPAAAPTAPGSLAPPRAAAITAASESGNRDMNPDGSPVTSPAGARYAMQVMPSTAHNPGFGISPAQSDTPAEYDRVGKQYLQVMADRYGGDMSKAWAAYNAGPGAVDRAIAGSGANYLSALPAQTRSYVSGNMSAMSGGNPIVQQAQQAIAAGADPQAVRARALSMGVTLP